MSNLIITTNFDSDVYNNFSNVHYNTIRSFKNAVRAFLAQYSDAKLASEDSESFTIYHDWDTITISYDRQNKVALTEYSLDN